MKTIPFSSSDRYTIGKFIFSYTKDLVMRGDAVNLVTVLFRNELLFNMNSWLKHIEKRDNRVATRLLYLLEENIPKEQLTNIMRDYYGVSKERQPSGINKPPSWSL